MAAAIASAEQGPERSESTDLVEALRTRRQSAFDAVAAAAMAAAREAAATNAAAAASAPTAAPPTARRAWSTTGEEIKAASPRRVAPDNVTS
eukprot:3377480-Prymnesium_polylepis.1